MSRAIPRQSVLYDVPGPRARALHRLLSAFGIVLSLGVIGFVLWRMAVTGQLEAAKWTPFTYTDIQLALLDGLWATLQIAAVGTVLALTLGALLAAARLSDRRWVSRPATGIIEFFRALPLLLLIFFAFYLGAGTLDPFWSVVIGLTLYNGAVLAEIFRSGINALPAGQAEAGYALGLRKAGVMTLILVPQAVRAMLPTIIAQIVVLLKDSALGFIVGYQDLLRAVNQIGTQYFNLLPAFIVGAAMYISVNLLVAAVAKWLERYLREGRSKKTPSTTAERTAPEAITPAE